MTRLGVGVAVVMCVTLTSCGRDRDKRGAEVSTTTSLRRDAVGLVVGDYDPGDCVTWETGAPRVAATTEVVPCAGPHRVQVVANIGPPRTRAGAFPTKAEWDHHEKVKCGPAIERFLGRPLDPYGRFTAGTLIPNISKWEIGDRDV